MAQIVWTESALNNLRQIIDHVSKDSPQRAEKLAARLTELPEILVHTPLLGRRVPEFDQDHIRELVTVRPYRLIYVVREDVCHIAAIVHGRRHLPNVLKPEDLDVN